jgi:Cu(I)/Ag(I) efflux system membrane fusion protein
MNTRTPLLIACLAGTAGLAVGGTGMWLVGRFQLPPTEKPTAHPLYQCPMHPGVTSDHPGDCPICGMKLILVAAKKSSPGEEVAAKQAAPVEGLSEVSIDTTRQQFIGLRTTRVRRGPVAETWRTVGRVQIDPTRVHKTNVKVDGFIERIFVDFVGQPVRKGQPLFSLYSPDLLATQKELLLAARTKDALSSGGPLAGTGDDLMAAAQRKLLLADVPQEEIERLQRTGEPQKSLVLVAPVSGTVTAKNVVQGASLRVGDAAYEITDLGQVWVMADAYESDLGRVHKGMTATLTLAALPNRIFHGKVDFVDPVLDPQSRTAKLRIQMKNPKGELRPEMYGDVVLEGKPHQGLLLPADAVLQSGTRNVVFVAQGQGKLQPREVKLGQRSGDEVEIASGLNEGDQVATRAAFLVDSESQLRASLNAIGGQ